MERRLVPSGWNRMNLPGGGAEGLSTIGVIVTDRTFCPDPKLPKLPNSPACPRKPPRMDEFDCWAPPPCPECPPRPNFPLRPADTGEATRRRRPPACAVRGTHPHVVPSRPLD